MSKKMRKKRKSTTRKKKRSKKRRRRTDIKIRNKGLSKANREVTGLDQKRAMNMKTKRRMKSLKHRVEK